MRLLNYEFVHKQQDVSWEQLLSLGVQKINRELTGDISKWHGWVQLLPHKCQKCFGPIFSVPLMSISPSDLPYSCVFHSHTCSYNLSIQVLNDCLSTVNTEIIFPRFFVLARHCLCRHGSTQIDTHTRTHTRAHRSVSLNSHVQIVVMGLGNCSNCHLAFRRVCWG